MLAALYGTGLRPGDRFFCPSSPAWGHGLWHGTLAPLALGLTIGAFSGKFNAERLLQALHDHRFTNLSAAATHYRMMRNCGAAPNYAYFLDKLSFTGEPIDSETADFAEQTFGHPVCSMYGTTEIGVILVNYPGAPDFVVKPGSLGKPMPGGKVEVQDADGTPCAPGVTGELKVWRRDGWIPTKDLGPRRRGRLLLSRRPRRRRDHLRRLDHERGRDRGRDPQAPATCRKPRRSACPTHCAARSSRPSSSRRAPATTLSSRKSRISCARA